MNQVEQLGMGMMRLPLAGGEIDLAETIRMADRFLADGGVWFDTAWGTMAARARAPSGPP
jgi:predicted aldo/keto reductase-like oxidoreductase